jgi:hypothetical protein
MINIVRTQDTDECYSFRYVGCVRTQHFLPASVLLRYRFRLTSNFQETKEKGKGRQTADNVARFD